MDKDVRREYFEFIADLGHTKHYVSLAATQGLIELCRAKGLIGAEQESGVSKQY